VTVPCLMEVARRRISFQCVRIALRLMVPPIMGCQRLILDLAVREVQLGLGSDGGCACKAEAGEVHQGEDVVGEASGVRVVLLDPRVGFVVKQPASK
jgi:hypothetical protein